MTNNLTPADVEYVRARDLRVGDVIVAFTAIGHDIDVPPTQRQLRASRTRYTKIMTIGSYTTPAEVQCIDFNAALGDDVRITSLASTGVWRVRNA
jgi:hypothetical protein